jgi:hypothetical protein
VMPTCASRGSRSAPVPRPAYAFLAVNQPHLDPVRGYSRNQNALRDWWRAMQSERNADRTERKASGIHMMLGVPSSDEVHQADGTKSHRSRM